MAKALGVDPELITLRRRQVVDPLSQEVNLAFVGIVERAEQMQERALARPALPHDRREPTRLDREVDPALGEERLRGDHVARVRVAAEREDRVVLKEQETIELLEKQTTVPWPMPSEDGLIHLDDWEMREDVQAEVADRFARIASHGRDRPAHPATGSTHHRAGCRFDGTHRTGRCPQW